MTHPKSFLPSRAAAWVFAGLLGLAAAPACAQSTLVFTGDAGDYISQGRTWSYTEGVQATGSSDQRVVSVSVWTDSTWWNLDFAAPAGAALVPGVYEGATRYPFNDGAEPGLSLSGDGRGCNTLTGRFEVLEAVYGPFGYVERFRATFEQHCEGGATAAWGEVVIANPPPPAALAVALRFDGRVAVERRTGVATVTGTATCSSDVHATLQGRLSQRVSRHAIAQGSFYLGSGCSPAGTPFRVEVPSSNGVPFGNGQGQLDGTLQAWDPVYSGYVSHDASQVVNLSTKR